MSRVIKMPKSIEKDVIKFIDYDVLGFDMDYTLARYKLLEFFELTYGCICKFLVKNKGYDSSIFHGLQEDKDLVYKGLIADVERGNVLKLGSNGDIIRASHGTKRLNTEEISNIYGSKKMFPYYEDFILGSKGFEKKWRFFENYFEIPGLVAFSQIVDYLEKKTDSQIPQSFTQAYTDITECFEDMYVPTQFDKNQGGYFPSIKAETRKFIEPISQEVQAWLKNLRQDGRKLFLMTSSFPDYSELIMTTMLGEDWKSYFDLCLYGARKPKFFTEQKPFIKAASWSGSTFNYDWSKGTAQGLSMQEVRQLEAGQGYCHGNFDDLMAFFRDLIGKDHPNVMYFGDNLFADAWPSTALAGWDCVLILEEMDGEGYAATDGTVLGYDDDIKDPSVPPVKWKHTYQHSSLVTKEEIDLMESRFWGSVFKDSSSTSSLPSPSINGAHYTPDMMNMNTCYGHLIARYSTICVPSIEYLSGVPVDHEFSTFSTTPGNARGFHPGRPKSLLPS